MGPSAYQYTDSKSNVWYLHSKTVRLRNGHEQVIFYFKKEEDFDYSAEMPSGFEVIETSKTGMPVLKKLR